MPKVLPFLLTLTYISIRILGIPIRQKWKGFRAGKLNDEQLKYLKQYSTYYRKLKPGHQKEFRKRVAIFIYTKEFIPRQLDYVTEEMKILVASMAIKITKL